MINISVSESSESSRESIKLEPYKQSPTIVQQIKKVNPLTKGINTVTNITTSVIRHVGAGMPQVSDEERSSRMAICKGCPLFNREDPENPKCNECGCYLKIKTSWALESCPQKKWGPAIVSKNCGCGG